MPDSARGQNQRRVHGLQVHVEVEVGQSVEAVWRYVVEGYFEHHSRWDPAGVETVKLTSGPVAAGTRGREVRRFAGRQAAGFTVTDAAEPSRFALSNTSGPFALDRTYEFKPNGAGCTVSFSFDMRPGRRCGSCSRCSATPSPRRSRPTSAAFPPPLAEAG